MNAGIDIYKSFFKLYPLTEDGRVVKEEKVETS